MRILGLDPSLSSTGWALVEDNKIILRCGTIKTAPKDGTFETRIRIIRRELTNKAISGACANYIAIEDIFVNRRNIKTSIKLAKLHGAILANAQDTGFSDSMIKVYEPAFIKNAITGNGNAPKGQVLGMVKILTDYKGNQEDISDAIAVALTCERDINKRHNKKEVIK